MLWENKLYQEDLGETYEYLKSILGERKSILVTGVTGLIGSYFALGTDRGRKLS